MLFEGLHINHGLKAPDSQECVLEKPGRQKNVVSISKSQSSEVAPPETSQNSLFFPAALKEKRTTPGRFASHQR
ncbi:hypothetical protein TNCV_4432311 [Trichonephila clavipes]|nr:hypothetical protein TNCV_4432311 [Trichonephila clavipes]